MKRIYFAAAALLVVVSLVWATDFYIDSAGFSAARVEKLTEFHQEQLTLYRENNQLLTTLCTLIFGAIGALLVKGGPEAGLGLHKFWAAASCVFAAISLYFGYVSHRQVIWMLDSQFFDLFNKVVAGPARIQFYSFLFSVILFGISLRPEK